MQAQQLENLKKFLSEIQMLKRVEHIGIKLAGAHETDSLGEHIALSTQIAYIVGELEGADAAKCAVINLFHDNHESRIGDHNKVSSRYLDTHEAEKQAEQEQFDLLPDKMGNKLISLLQEKHLRNTKEGIIAQDADWLEVAIEAKVNLEQGLKGCQIWLDNVEKALETDSAKEIFQVIKNEPDFINCWWTKIQKMTYKKLDKN